MWREIVQIGRETTYGTAVPATRKMYGMDVSLTRQRDFRPYRFATATRDNQRGATLGPVQAGGSFKFAMSADEIIEPLLIGVKGAVTPTSPGATAKLWTFTPGTALDSATFERNDGAQIRRAVGVYVDQMTIAGSASGDNSVTCTLFGADLQNLGALTAGLTDRTPTYMDGWQTNLYLDAFGGTPGTTFIVGSLINWNVQLQNNLGRKYTASNTLAATGITTGLLDVTVQLTLEASAAQAATEFTNWDLQTKRLMRLEFIDSANLLDAGTNEIQTVTITGGPTGGTYTLTYLGTVANPVAGQTTYAIPYNATAAQVQAALEALPAIGAGNVLGGGGPHPATPITVTFQGVLAGTNIVQMTETHTGLTGGTTPAAAVTTSTPGVNGTRRFVTVDVPLQWSAFDLTQNDANTRTYQLNGSYIFDAVNSYGIQIRAQNLRSTAF